MMLSACAPCHTSDKRLKEVFLEHHQEFATLRQMLEQVLERALPFREGEEVFVEIVEPHMYQAGDAVAKIDGYVICVTGADPYVGTKQLVRIDDVGRNQAIATLVEVPGAAQPARLESGDGNDDELDSKPRRRGRRGGRRRSGAKAESAAAAPSTSE